MDALNAELNKRKRDAVDKYKKRELVKAARNEPKHERGCNQHECQPGCIVGNKGQIDNKQGVPGLIADNKQSNNAALNTQAEKIKERIKKTEAGKIISKMLSEYLNRKQGEEPSNEKNIIGEVSQKTIDEVLRIGGPDLTGYKIALIEANYHHAYRKHTHLKQDDIFLIPDVAENWDSIQYTQKKNDADRLSFRKEIDNVKYRLVAKIGSPKKELSLYVTTFFGENLPNK